MHVVAELQVASRTDSITVTAERPRGEAEAINRAAHGRHILNVLPAEVITSLPNANIADALDQCRASPWSAMKARVSTSRFGGPNRG